MKNKADKLPNFLRSNKCPANDNGHEPLMNSSYIEESLPVSLTCGSYLGVWEDGSLEVRVCKHCQLLFAMPIKYFSEDNE